MPSDAFWLLHTGLSREGPGSDASTREAIRRLPLPPEPVILDLGCGPGAQTLVLAQSLGVPICAIDTHQPFLDRLAQAARQAGMGSLIETRNLSMTALDYPPESVGLIWCEAAIYLLGVSLALEQWWPCLRPGGVVAFSDATWLADERPKEAAGFWNVVYPAMTTISGSLSRILEAGFEPVDAFVLPQEDWWNDYYNPLLERMTVLRSTAPADALLRDVLDDHEREIELFRRYGGSYGYAFYLARKRL
jgi:serine/threonine-protein kinase HipA